MLGDFKVPLPQSVVSVPPEIVMGIRPENVRIAQPQDTQTIQGRVYLVENLGMHNLVSVRVQDARSGAIAVRALLPTDQNWSDREITLALHPQNIHWFDLHTGDAVFRRR